jgi:hypothetical protein
MKGLGLSLLALALAILLRRYFQTPFETMDTTNWASVIPGLPFQFLTGYIVPQLLLGASIFCWKEGFARQADRLLARLSSPWICPTLVFIVAVSFRHFGLQDVLLVSDEFSSNFEAICFARGCWGSPPPPFPDHFQYSTQYIGPWIWTGIYTPGWPMLLAIGHLLGFPRMLSPLLGALTTFQLQSLARRWSGPGSAGLTGLLLLASPMFVLHACSDYSHLATVFWTASTLLCLDRIKQPGGLGRGGLGGDGSPPQCLGWSLAGGLSLGAVATTRPLDGLILLCALLVWRLLIPGPSGRPKLVQIALVGLGTALTSSLLFLQNIAISGKATVTAYALVGELSGQFDLPASSRLPLALFMFARAILWMFPGFLEFLPQLRSRNGKFGLFLLLLYTFAYSHIGSCEIGTRYLLAPCVVAVPLIAGAILKTPDRRGWIIPCLALSLLGTYPGYSRIMVQAYRSQGAFDQWIDQATGSNSILFFRALPPGVLGFARNHPWLVGRVSALALDPEENRQIRRFFSNRSAYYVDWDPEQLTWLVTPFEAPHDIDLDRICAGSNYANLKSTQAKALQQWAQVSPQSPFFDAATQNRIKLLSKLGRTKEALELAGQSEKAR